MLSNPQQQFILYTSDEIVSVRTFNILFMQGNKRRYDFKRVGGLTLPTCVGSLFVPLAGDSVWQCLYNSSLSLFDGCLLILVGLEFEVCRLIDVPVLHQVLEDLNHVFGSVFFCSLN